MRNDENTFRSDLNGLEIESSGGLKDLQNTLFWSFFEHVKKGVLRRCGQALFVPQKSKNYCFVGFKNDTLLFISLFGVWVPPPPPPGGSTEGGHFDPEWLAVRYALDLPPHPGGTPPDPLFGGISDLRSPLLPDHFRSDLKVFSSFLT